ncbi:MAG: MBL fold metallo-hydrolase [Candidatus Odinarchaeota archaeon]
MQGNIGSFVQFLGTGGGRFVMITQTRKTGGLWIRNEHNDLIIDPGPGYLINSLKQPHINPGKLKAIILTHNHLDHSNDLNLAIEAMTLGGFRKNGELIITEQALHDNTAKEYILGSLDELTIIKEGMRVSWDGMKISFPLRHEHKKAETYGVTFEFSSGIKLAYITDGIYQEGIARAYSNYNDIVILNSTMVTNGNKVGHLDFEGAARVIDELKPRITYLNHFGREACNYPPEKAAEEISYSTGQRVYAAEDFQLINLETSDLLGSGKKF